MHSKRVVILEWKDAQISKLNMIYIFHTTTYPESGTYFSLAEMYRGE